MPSSKNHLNHPLTSAALSYMRATFGSEAIRRSRREEQSDVAISILYDEIPRFARDDPRRADCFSHCAPSQ
jgi:hypothetical protein